MYSNWINSKDYFRLAALAILLIFVLGVAFAEMQEPKFGPFGLGLNIKNVDWNNSTGQIKVIFQNYEKKNITINEIFVNGLIDEKNSNISMVLAPNQTAEIILTETYPTMPKRIRIEFQADNFQSGYEHIFIDFEMLRVYWNQNTGKINILVTNIGQHPEVNFKEIYINETVDEKAVITKQNFEPSKDQIYEIFLSKTYLNKPKNMQIKIVTTDGTSFELSSPFVDGSMIINSIKWFKETGQIKFLVYIGTASFIEKEQDIKFDKIYVNGTLDENVAVNRIYSETYEITLSKTYQEQPSEVTVKVLTDYGAIGEEYDNNLTW